MRQPFPALLTLALLAATSALAGCGSGREWTTDSEAALGAFRQGLDAEMKYYTAEAREHFQEALALDPDFTAARLLLMELTRDPEKRQRLLAELQEADLGTLTPRERFLIQYYLADAEGRNQEREQLLATYLEKHPDDPWALAVCSAEAWSQQDWKRAAEQYRRLLDVDPNWVLAHNHLGYVAMAQGRFEEAEEHFRTYAFVAPDQANPHDSMGELLTVLGRYDEARRELEEALRIRPDFCNSYQNLMSVAVLEGRPEELAPLVARARERCDPAMVETLHCGAFLWRSFLSLDFGAPWREEDRPSCLDTMTEGHFLVHRMAVLSGRREVAEEEEARYRARIEELEAKRGAPMERLRAVLLHLEGSRLAIEGQYAEAAERLRQADELIDYWGQGGGILKLYNRLNLAYALEHAGETAASRQALDQVRAVNPAFAGFYDELEMTPRIDRPTGS